LLIFTWILTQLVLLFTGGDGKKGIKSLVGIDYCTWQYWALFSSNFPILVLVTLFALQKLKKDYNTKCKIGYPFVDGDVKWTTRMGFIFPIAAIVAGIMAGLLGVGGGLVKGPLMLEMGILPQIAASTSAYMIVFTASSAFVQYLIMGSIPWQPGLWYGTAGFIASLGGQMSMDHLVKKYKKTSYIAFLIGGITVLSTIGLAVIGIIPLVKGTAKTGFHPIC